MQDVSYILAAMLPCSRLYAFLGHALLAAQEPGARHDYTHWVETYSSDEFGVRCGADLSNAHAY
jgi:thiaminase/transcriptional activator TenA